MSFDLQSAQSPYSDNMNLYYSRKYSTYKCTVYESGNRNSYCYLWGEIDGLRGSNERVTCIFKYLTALNEQNKFVSVALYCDFCAGQNKKRAMMTMIEYGLMNVWTKIKKIKITYLLPGHTYMPVDSVHSVIERCIKKKTISGPSEWPTIIRNARIYPKPYIVINLKLIDFLDWKILAAQWYSPQLKYNERKQKIQISKVKSFIITKIMNELSKEQISIHVYFTYNAEEVPLTLVKKKKNNHCN